MRTLVAGLLLGTTLLAQADPATDAANARFAGVLESIEGGRQGFSPRIGRLIGWSGGDVRPLAPSEQLDQLLEAYWAWSQTVQPESATFTGFPGQNNRWSDVSASTRAEIDALEVALLRVIDGIDAQALAPDARLNLALLRTQVAHDVDGQQFPEHVLPVNQMFGLQTWIPSVLGAQPLRTAADREDFLARLRGLPLLLTQARALLEEGLERNITPPRITLAKVPAQFLALAPEQGLDSPLLAPLKSLPKDWDTATREDFQARALALYGEQLRPALLAMYIYVRDTYVPGAVRATGLKHLEDGAAWYAHEVRGYTTTELGPEEIHQMGLDEVDRIRGEIEAVMAEVEFRGSIQAFAAKLKQDPKWYYTQAEDYLQAYRALGKVVDARLPKLFSEFPGLPYGIEPVPEFRAQGAPVAYYLPGSIDFGRPGVFYINTLRMASSPKYEMEALLVHEAVPGHHFQIALAQELKDVPAFRQHARFTAYIEGWGLYAESLGPELGLYEDPYSRFGALSFEMWRAVRLVVDTGLHALGWSREQAIEYFAEHTGRDRERIATEIDRYLVLPGQALAYKIGERKIRELRTRAEEQLGEAFDLRAFHARVLGAGALPLSLLEQRIDSWIAQQQNNTETQQ